MKPLVALLIAGVGMTAAAWQEPADMPAAWSAAQAPVRLFGNVYYVGTRGLSALLLTSSQGHVLLDAALASTAPALMANIRALGFKVEDIELIVNSHPHYDHAGGIAALQRASGATVAALPAVARVLETGIAGKDDPQYGLSPAMEKVANVQRIRDGETLRVGEIAITAHETGGHTPGATTWSWQSCAVPSAGQPRCLDFVYADSLNAVSADAFLFSRSPDYPAAVADFEKGFAAVSALPCDVLVTPHPEATDLWGRLSKRTGDAPDALVDAGACRRYAETRRTALAARLAREKGPR
jgi:metallo-beta-lactamase class B